MYRTGMIRELGVKIVAEGVETEEQVKQLTSMGVTHLQGYYFSKPMSETAYIEFFRKNQPGRTYWWRG